MTLLTQMTAEEVDNDFRLRLEALEAYLDRSSPIQEGQGRNYWPGAELLDDELRDLTS